MDVANTPVEISDCVLNHFLKSARLPSIQVRLKLFCCINYTLLQSFELKNLIKELVKSNYVSTRLLSLVNASLLKLYPTFVQSKLITMEDIQEWDFWPKILIYFGMYANV